MKALLRILLATLWLTSLAIADDLKTLNFTVDGVQRTALIHVPNKTDEKSPLVFVFHGHGGSSRNAERTFQTDTLWPEAISIYPQGLPTVGQLTDPQGERAGWQARPGNDGDRDLHFFDAMLKQVERDYAVDTARIYCTGHSNSGGFTYLLWKERPEVFASVAVSSAAALYATQLAPKPAMILGGENDPLVKFAWQQRMMEIVRKTNGCDATAGSWQGGAKLYVSKTGTPLITYSHDGGHAMDASEPGLIVKFFRQTAPTTRP